MPLIRKHKVKTKVTISLDTQLLEAVDRLAARPDHGSRSSTIEHILRQWYAEQLQRQLEEETERYYLSLTKAEQNEDRRWARMATGQAKRLWE